MHKNESAENYLEAILMLSKEQLEVRSIDVVNELGFKKSSVSVAMKKLRESGEIEMGPDGHITLTDSGLAIAEKILERHELISSWLKRLGVDPETAVEDACGIEHVISTESFEAVKKYILAHQD